MKNILFPTFFKFIGWILFVPGLIVGGLCFFNLMAIPEAWLVIIRNSIILSIVIGSMFIVCSRRPVEDEMTRTLRLGSMLNSIYAYVLILICTMLTLSKVDFLGFATLNTVLLPIIFVFNFQAEMRRYNKMSENEE